MAQKNLQTEIVKALEDGFNKHLNRSIIYSPFRLFFNLFKKSNPKSIERAREIIREDVFHIMSEVVGFDESVFLVKQNQFTPKGKELLKKCYNIGIRILKKDLTVMLAFKALRNHELREEIYQDILVQIQNAIFMLLEPQPLIEEQTNQIEEAKD